MCTYGLQETIWKLMILEFEEIIHEIFKELKERFVLLNATFCRNWLDLLIRNSFSFKIRFRLMMCQYESNTYFL